MTRDWLPDVLLCCWVFALDHHLPVFELLSSLQTIEIRKLPCKLRSRERGGGWETDHVRQQQSGRSDYMFLRIGSHFSMPLCCHLFSFLLSLCCYPMWNAKPRITRVWVLSCSPAPSSFRSSLLLLISNSPTQILSPPAFAVQLNRSGRKLELAVRS